MGRESPDVQYEGVVSFRSGKAILFQADCWEAPEWIPLSQCFCDPVEDSDEPGRCAVAIRDWLVAKNGWVRF